VTLPVPPPVITITGPGAVRTNEPADIVWSVEALYPISCTLRGPSLTPRSINLTGTAGTLLSENDTTRSGALTNSGRFEISCTVGTDTYSESFTVEVIPTFQEI